MTGYRPSILSFALLVAVRRRFRGVTLSANLNLTSASRLPAISRKQIGHFHALHLISCSFVSAFLLSSCLWDGTIGADRPIENDGDSQGDQDVLADPDDQTGQDEQGELDDDGDASNSAVQSDDNDVDDDNDDDDDDNDLDDDDDDDDDNGEDESSSSSGDIDDPPPTPDEQECIDRSMDPACDDWGGDLGHILGMNCDRQNSGLEFAGYTVSLIAIDRPFGEFGFWKPTEGNRMLGLSNGVAESLLFPIDYPAFRSEFCSSAGPMGPMGPMGPICPNTDLGHFSRTLPGPLSITPVDLERKHNCGDNKDLIGQGDCSNSLVSSALSWPPPHPHPTVFDYAELRVVLEVPEQSTGLSFDFAFFTAESPPHLTSPNHTDSPQGYDLFVAWLESDLWTGNMIYDRNQDPISSHSEFIAFNDTRKANLPSWSGVAPELHNTGMETHIATPWLRTIAPVKPGETITLVFSIFDTVDGQVDSIVLLDNFRWTCHDRSEPETSPVNLD